MPVGAAAAVIGSGMNPVASGVLVRIVVFIVIWVVVLVATRVVVSVVTQQGLAHAVSHPGTELTELHVSPASAKFWHVIAPKQDAVHVASKQPSGLSTAATAAVVFIVTWVVVLVATRVVVSVVTQQGLAHAVSHPGTELTELHVSPASAKFWHVIAPKQDAVHVASKQPSGLSTAATAAVVFIVTWVVVLVATRVVVSVVTQQGLAHAVSHPGTELTELHVSPASAKFWHVIAPKQDAVHVASKQPSGLSTAATAAVVFIVTWVVVLVVTRVVVSVVTQQGLAHNRSHPESKLT